MKKVVIIISVVSILTAWLTIVPSSQDYWEGIGPSWDRMLNPDTHSD
jgi:hypothetical protein